MKKNWLKNFAIALAVLVYSSASHSAELKGVSMPDSEEVEGKKLVLNGMGVRLATIFDVKVYVAGLYLEHKSSDADAILKSTEVKKFHMQFVRDVEVAKSQNAWEESFSKHCEKYCDAYRKKMDQLKASLEEMKKGDTQTYVFTPKGVKILMKGKLKADIEGADFASFILAGWIGPYPPNKSLKEGVLGLLKD